LKYPRSIFRKSPSSLAFHEQRSRELRYVWAVTLVALGLLIGFILQPSFGRSQAYATFYPVVLFAAYVLGPRPAAVATALSAAVAYWCFVPPDFQWKWDTQVGAALAFFLGTSAIAIYAIDRLLRTLSDRSGRRTSKTDLARVNAVIFAELGARPASGWAPLSAPMTARPSERSFDAVRLDQGGVEADSAERASPRKPEPAPAGERGATLH
jgi:K+-sensing histidine kinase KdpD